MGEVLDGTEYSWYSTVLLIEKLKVELMANFKQNLVDINPSEIS